MRRNPNVWMLLAVVLVVAAGCGGERGGAKAADEVSAKKTGAALLAASDVAAVTRANLVAGVPVSGTLTPAVDVRISAPVVEVIDQVLVREGQTVARGQLLARFKMGAIEAAVASAKAQLKVATADYERFKNLLSEGAISQREVEAAEAAYRVARANEALAVLHWEDANVRAPIAGVISVKSVAAGDRPGEGDPMFRLVNTSELDFEATVPSEFVAQIKVGSTVRLSISGYAAGSITGRVARINAAVDEATRQVKVYVQVPNPGRKLVGGLFATGNVVTKEARSVVAVPSRGVHTEGAAMVALVVKDGKIERREVQLGLHDEALDLVEVAAGLAPGDVVVTGPTEGLTPGRTVQVAGKES